MYLKQLHVENNGPLRRVHLELPFTATSMPKPIVLVGGNGSGKTNLLSTIGDALLVAAASHYTNVLAGAGPNRPYFRVVGPRTISVGASGSFTVMQFEHDGTTYLFREKGSHVTPAEARDLLPESLRPAVNWSEKGNVKSFSIGSEQAGQVFQTGVYLYFPSNRAEAPHWLNVEAVATPEFDLQPRITHRSYNPIYVEKALERFQQWILSVILEARCDFEIINPPDVQGRQVRLAGNIPRTLQAKQVLQLANNLLRQVLGDTGARFAWLGRAHPEKLGFATSSGIIPTLEALSAGQATLLGIFGTILSYGDQSGFSHDDISGICLVDEIDAHMHVDLQHRALPELVRLFPKVQFIVSSHSPLFVLGMENTFGTDGLAIIDMPSGTAIHAEAYAEFGHALQVLQDTKAFAAAIEAAAGAPGKALVLLEGETDPIYLQTAAEFFGRHALLDKVELESVGAKDPKGGQAYNTGKSALNHALTFLRAKPDLVKRPIILLYDTDANKAAEDHGQLHVRTMPSNAANTKVQDGIENLLPQDSISDEMFDKRKKDKRQGGYTIDMSLNKMRLCNYICQEKRDPADFAEFGAVLDMIEGLVEPGVQGAQAPADAGPP
jgi:AAA domain, putative AbiEii toxin, Type IV TA system